MVARVGLEFPSRAPRHGVSSCTPGSKEVFLRSKESRRVQRFFDKVGQGLTSLGLWRFKPGGQGGNRSPQDSTRTSHPSRENLLANSRTRMEITWRFGNLLIWEASSPARLGQISPLHEGSKEVQDYDKSVRVSRVQFRVLQP